MNTHAVVKRDNKKFLNNFNGAVAMHRGSCKKGPDSNTVDRKGWKENKPRKLHKKVSRFY